jgi:hypothetical protein
MSSSTTYTVTCPHCGLLLTITQRQGEPSLSYDTDAWRRLCKQREQQSPAFCLSERNIGGDSPQQ